MSARAKDVLLLTHGEDLFVVERVALALARRGARAVRVDTERYPSELPLSARIGSTELDLSLWTSAGETRLADVRAVWVRRIWTPRLPPGLDERYRAGCERAAQAGLLGSLGLLSGARWVDPPHLARRAEDKLLQLRTARELGLLLPPTLVTNDPEALRAFHAEQEGQVVAKMLVPLSRGMRREGLFVPTSPVRAEDLAAAEGLRHAPMIFQQRIEKGLELRVVLCAGRALCGALDATGTAGAEDWRQAAPGDAPWRPAEIPAALERALLALLARLGLSFGVADLVRTPAGEHVFLELNPGGEWGMLERDLDLPIAEAIAETLLAEEPRNPEPDA